MQLETYSLVKRPASYYYEFFSDGPNGSIKKVVEFYRLEEHKHEVFNLAFGDWDENNHCINRQLSYSDTKSRFIRLFVLDQLSKMYPD